MKISLNWIKEYVDLSGLSTEEIIKKLNDSGLEVENVEDKAAIFNNIEVGLVKEKKRHPNADKLSLCVVNDGVNDYNVVCGAPNVEKGKKIAFAKIGAIVPDGNFKINKTKIRGEISEGMICSEKELGLGEDHSGILILNDDCKIGEPLVNALGIEDVVIEISVTPNRADALSHLGIARDLAALFKREFKLHDFKVKESSIKTDSKVKIEIINEIDCPRYCARVLTNIKINESPQWLKSKLLSVGLRPINNIVDVTNFILYELGQPLHAFDFDKLTDNKIVVRNVASNYSFKTLDSKERKLREALMIWDGEKPVAIAGVMGGANSEITESTKNILIESAYFNPSSIRKTAKHLGLSTDSSYRFERGCDPNIAEYAVNKAAYLINEIAGGEILKGVLDVYPNKIEGKKINFRYSRIDTILGYKIEESEVDDILKRLGCELLEKKKDLSVFKAPTFRPDIEREIDLIEEVARIYGYDKIPKVERITISLEQKTDESEFADLMRDSLTALGFYEILNNTLQKTEIAELTGKPVNVMNPQTIEMASLRTSLIPGVLYSISNNFKVGEKNLKFFEIGKTFNRINESVEEFNDFVENEKVIIALTGKMDENEWHSKERKADIFDLKGMIDSFLTKISLDNELTYSYYNFEDKIFEQKIAISRLNEELGCGGLIKKNVLNLFDVEQSVYCFEFDLEKFKTIPKPIRKFKELLKYPKIARDCAFIVDKNVSSEEIMRSIRKGASQLLKNIRIFDIFEGENIGKEKKSMAFSLEYYDINKTLTEKEADEDFNNSINSVLKEHNAKLRGA